MREDIKKIVRDHYDGIGRVGLNPKSVGWPNAPDLATRYEILMAGVDFEGYDQRRRLRLLDLGCGPGFLLEWLSVNDLLTRVDYLGVDVTDDTMRHARANWPCHRFDVRDVREQPFSPRSFDVCIACGVLNARGLNSHEDMLALAKATLTSVWPSVEIGLAFNVMSKHVDWERPDLFYWALDEIMTFCKSAMSPHVSLRLDGGPWETAVVVRRHPVATRLCAPAEWSVRP